MFPIHSAKVKYPENASQLIKNQPHPNTEKKITLIKGTTYALSPREDQLNELIELIKIVAKRAFMNVDIEKAVRKMNLIALNESSSLLDPLRDTEWVIVHSQETIRPGSRTIHRKVIEITSDFYDREETLLENSLINGRTILMSPNLVGNTLHNRNVIRTNFLGMKPKSIIGDYFEKLVYSLLSTSQIAFDLFKAFLK